MTARRPLNRNRATGAEAAEHAVDPHRRACVLGALGAGVAAAAMRPTTAWGQGAGPAPHGASLPVLPAASGGAAAAGSGLSGGLPPLPSNGQAPPLQPQLRPSGIQSLELSRSDEGLLLAFVLAFELPRSVEDALLKGLPLHFTAQAQLMRERWYWTDRRVATAVRGWRLTYQPLTRRFRVGQGGLAQNLDDLESALAACARASAWRIAEPAQLEDGARHYVEFSYRLDTSLLPRPMQIGIGGQPDWNLGFERTLRVD